MLALIRRALPFAPWILAGLAVLAALYYRSDAANEAANAAEARSERDKYRAEVAERIAANNAAVLEEIQKLSAKADEATAREVVREREAKRVTATRLSEIDNAPATADGPVAPVLRDVLRPDGMRRP